jgi:hypothetical protein
MTDLRSALHDYTTVDEPPMRITANEVITAAKGKRRRRSIVVSGGISTAVAVATVLITVPAVFTSSGLVSPPAPALSKCLDVQNDETAMRKCVVGELLTAELPGAKIEQMNVHGVVGGGYRVDTLVSNPAGQVHLEVTRGPVVSKPGDPPGACLRLPDCTEQAGPHGEAVTISTKPDPAYPEGKALFVGSYTPNAQVGIFTIQMDQTKRLLDTDALIRIATTPQLLP